MTSNMDGFVKITNKMVADLNYRKLDIPLQLCDWIRNDFDLNINGLKTYTDDLLVDCESPIEQALALQMAFYSVVFFEYFTSGKIDVLEIENQVQLEVYGHKYRVDFLIPVIYKIKKETVYKTFVVECDGHDYHEKSKEQVACNNHRERDLKAAGYEVVRFSGSEIYKNATQCVKDLMRIIFNEYLRLEGMK